MRRWPCALAQRLIPAPIDFEKARGILLVGPSGSGKSAVAAKIARAAALIGRKTELTRADGGLALFRTDSNPPELLTVMEADGFNPLNARAASAFSALGDIEGVETIGVVSALNDAEDIADIVSAFRFRRVIVTGLDRTRRLGAVLAASLSGARLAHVTYGPRPGRCAGNAGARRAGRAAAGNQRALTAVSASCRRRPCRRLSTANGPGPMPTIISSPPQIAKSRAKMPN